MNIALLPMNAVIQPGCSGQLVQRPAQMAPLRPLRLRVLATGAALDILDIKVGNRSQFKSSEPIPAEYFARSRSDHVEAIARWAETAFVRGASIARAIRRGDWKPDDYRDEEDSVPFPCEAIQPSMDFVMEVRNRDPERPGTFHAVWTCEEVREDRPWLSPSRAGTEMDAILYRMRAATETMVPRYMLGVAATASVEEIPAAATPAPDAKEPISDASGVGWDPYGDE